VRGDRYGLSGIVPILNTPFDHELALDYVSVARAVEQMIADGVVGVIVPAVASEVSKLTPAERKAYLEHVLEVTNGRVEVIAGVSSHDLDLTAELSRHAVRAGARVVLLQLPHSVDNYDGMRDWLESVTATGVEVIMLQDLDWGGGGISIELIQRLFETIPAFKSIKVETVPAGLKYTQIIAQSEGRLHVCGGWGLPQMIEGLDRGVDAFTPTAINKVFVEVYRHYRAGRRDEAVMLFEKIVPALAFACQHIDVSIHFLKRYCVRRKLFSTPNVRQPILPYDRYHERFGDELIERVILLEDSVDSSGRMSPEPV
jgi:dihydrodipicolinate synthase/N-acetylneuraminate lyase